MNNITIRNIPLNGSRPNPNMRELTFDYSGSVVFFSYRTPVAAKLATGKPGEWKYLRTSEHYSSTTTKHLNKWFRRNTVANDIVEEVDEKVLKALVPANVSL